jgi:hypothetical protein
MSHSEFLMHVMRQLAKHEARRPQKFKKTHECVETGPIGAQPANVGRSFPPFK